METNQFPMEYIGYLQEKNNDLMEKLNDMKEMYEKKIFMKDMNRQYLLSLMNDVLNVCTALPQEIDVFFEEMSSAMDTLKNILLKKSEMVQLAEKISLAIKPCTSKLEPQNSYSEGDANHKSRKKSSAVKVSPMINGHVILTEPRIFLSRVSKNLSPLKRNESKPLSPIVEVSPSASDSYTPRQSEFRESIESVTPKNYRHSLKKKNSSQNKKSPRSSTRQKSINNHNNEEEQSTTKVDPLEGPSWLFNDPKFSSCFVNFRRRRQKMAERFDRHKKINERRGNDDKLRKSVNGQDQVSNDKTSTLKKDEKRESTSRSPALKASAKKSESSGKQQTNNHSPEFIEGTPDKPSSTKNKSKEEILKEIALKQPLVSLEDCMTNKKLLKMISHSSLEKYTNETRIYESVSDKLPENMSTTVEEGEERVCENSKKTKTTREESFEDMFYTENSTCQPTQCIDSTLFKKETDQSETSGIDALTNLDTNKSPDEPLNINTTEEAGNSIDATGSKELNDNVALDEPKIEDKPSECEPITSQILVKSTFSGILEEVKVKNEKWEAVSSNGSRHVSEDETTSDKSNENSNSGWEPRKRRKAAPTNLCEPKLGTKLRRE